MTSRGALPDVVYNDCDGSSAIAIQNQGINMSTAVKTLLGAFDSLTENEKHLATVEILKRSWPADYGDVSEASLVEIADELFQVLDHEEARNAKP